MQAPTPEIVDPSIKARIRKLLEFEARPDFNRLTPDDPNYQWYEHERQELEIELAYLQRQAPTPDPSRLDDEYERALQARTA